MAFYQFYEFNHAAMAPWRAMADVARLTLQNPFHPLYDTPVARSVNAATELFERSTRRYGKPHFDLPTTSVDDGRTVSVEEQVVWRKPFCSLLHFKRDLPAKRKPDPKLLIVAPMSGHYATLLRGTVEAMLPDHEVFITDWTDARMVPMSDGGFGLDDYIDYVIDMLHHLGESTHVMAVCQPSVPVLAAVAIMEEDGDANAPATMTLMGGPIDTRIKPTVVNELAEKKGTDWFRNNVIMRVPFPHPGFMRPVYPGFLQLTGFMSMNLDRHMTAHRELFMHLVDGDGDSADRHRDFYDEYMAVMDLTAEFYLETVETVFVRHALPKGEMTYRDRPVKPQLIRNTALLTVEGEKDDISGVGQTKAAHDICSGLAKTKKAHHLQEKVGHYGVFNGSRFRDEIAPAIKKFVRKHDRNGKALNGAAKPLSMLRENDPGAKFADAMGITALKTNPIRLVADDLTQISGIGPKIADMLNDLGIVQIDQLAALTKDMTRMMDDELPRGQEAIRDWISQARALTAFEKK